MQDKRTIYKKKNLAKNLPTLLSSFSIFQKVLSKSINLVFILISSKVFTAWFGTYLATSPHADS